MTPTGTGRCYDDVKMVTYVVATSFGRHVPFGKIHQPYDQTMIIIDYYAWKL